MISPEKEIVPFNSKIDVNEGEKKGNVEKWLLEIELVMRQTLKAIAKKSMEDKDIRTKWVLKYPAMTTLMGDMMSWTNTTESALLASST
jgi:dynein heavy chain, axonemal